MRGDVGKKNMEFTDVKCCLCGNVHPYSERKEGDADKRYGIRPFVCPQCGSNIFTRVDWQGSQVKPENNDLNSGD